MLFTPMDTPLREQHCVPCEGGVKPLTREEALALAPDAEGWTLAPDAASLTREFGFKDFTEALGFVNKVGELAEAEGHHPDIDLRSNTVGLELRTHVIGGLSRNDFILAAKINRL